MYLYQATKDPIYLTMGVDVLEAIDHSAKTKCGYATVCIYSDMEMYCNLIPTHNQLFKVQNVIDHTLEG